MSKTRKNNISLFLATAITFTSLTIGDINANESASGLSLERIYGKDRYETSMNIIGKLSPSKVYLANGKSFSDALSVGPVAGKENAAVLLTDGKNLDVNKLKSKSVTEITIVGGENSISKDLENRLKKDFKVSRISGTNRYETSLKLVEKMGVKNIAVASGKDFPDALSAGAVLSIKGMPLLLVDGHSIDRINQDYNVVYTFGGPESVKKTFGKRIYGKDRYETSSKIARELGNYNSVVLTSGKIFADALSSSSLAKKLSAPIILSNGLSIPDEILNKRDIKKIILVGGDNSLSKDFEKSLLNKFKIYDSSDKNTNSSGSSSRTNHGLQDDLDNSKEVNIKDENLKKAVIRQLKHQKIYKDNQKITEKRMAALNGLDCHLNFTQGRNGGIKSLEGLEYAHNIKSLDLAGNEVVDLSPLKACKNLEVLDLGDQYLYENNQYLTDISPLGGLPNLKKLILKNNKIVDVTAISKLTNLEELDLYGNRGIKSIDGFEKLTKLRKLLLNRTMGITDIEPLKECMDLEELSIQYNKVSSIEALKKHEKLLSLDISGNKNISDLSPLFNSNKLVRLLANGNKITSLEGLRNMIDLKELHVSENKISDLSPLEKLLNLDDLDIGNNPDIESIEVLKNLTNISELKMNNAKKVKDFTPISSLKNLDELNITRCGLTDISFLEGLNNITEMNLQQNEITDINPLVNMGNLREIKLGYNKIFDASPVSKLRSKFKVAIEMGSQESEVDANNHLIKNPILDQSGNKLDINEKDNIKNSADMIEILNFNELNNGQKIKVRWGKDAEFFGSLTINIKK
ncbi:leucine Rich Repeat protein [Peptostreptococcus stomatis DSM 17678]|uniref:Leucine Rich Repeat protein n=1 Tax=Peptostreptococcus stomatis DSM 17678 TaxID=596315 RepID=E0E1A4_9FIRM|nr:cell wall-binding repeat-containing protein [Peptostreptococcus stomatis]EFM65350.1 leucine Rich Repeat protein [Peptostreptococcus stomatis DSM 17678]